MIQTFSERAQALRDIGMPDWALVYDACDRAQRLGGDAAILAELVPSLLESITCTCTSREFSGVCQHHDIRRSGMIAAARKLKATSPQTQPEATAADGREGRKP